MLWYVGQHSGVSYTELVSNSVQIISDIGLHANTPMDTSAWTGDMKPEDHAACNTIDTADKSCLVS